MTRSINTGGFAYNYDLYPDCCLMGLIHNFGGKLAYTAKEKEEIYKALEVEMDRRAHTTVMIADTENGAAYKLFSENDKTMILSSEFNKNSGNSVYIMKYSK